MKGNECSNKQLKNLLKQKATTTSKLSTEAYKGEGNKHYKRKISSLLCSSNKTSS